MASGEMVRVLVVFDMLYSMFMLIIGDNLKYSMMVPSESNFLLIEVGQCVNVSQSKQH